MQIDKSMRSAIKHQKPCVVWLTGLSGAGKSTIGSALERRLHAMGRHSYMLDGDNVRYGLNQDLDFTVAGRVENVRRVAEVARLMVDAGLVVIVALISPFRAGRQQARRMFEQGEFFEVFVHAPLEVAEARDPKGLYRKARQGELVHFTGIDSPYEPPTHPDLCIDTEHSSVDEACERVMLLMHHNLILSAKEFPIQRPTLATSDHVTRICDTGCLGVTSRGQAEYDADPRRST